MKKLLLALFMLPTIAHAIAAEARIDAYQKYLDCTFCGMMSLMPNQRIPQLRSLAVALASKNTKTTTPLVRSMHPVTAIIYHGIVALSGSKEKELQQVIRIIDQKIKILESSKKNEGKGTYDTVSEVITQRSSKHDQHRSSSTQKPNKK